MRLRATLESVVATGFVLALAACGGGDDSEPAASKSVPDPAAAFGGERAKVAEALVAYDEAVEAGDVEGLCEGVLVETKSIYERRNDCRDDPDNDALTGDAPGIEEITRIEILPGDYRSKRIPGQIRNWMAKDALQFLAGAYALVTGGETTTAYGLDKVDGEWRVVNRMDARAEEPPTAPDRKRFLAENGVLGAFGIVAESSDARCGDSIGQMHVDGTVTYVEADSARQAIINSELVGEKVREVLDGPGSLVLRSVHYRDAMRTYELLDGKGGVATIPVEGYGPTYYVNNFGGCSDNDLANDLLPF